MSGTELESTAEFESKWRQVKACARCHRLKMRCSYLDPSYKSCKRCFLIGVMCLVDEDPTAKFARKNRSKSSSTTTTLSTTSATKFDSEADLMLHLQGLVDSINSTLNLFERPKSDLQINERLRNLLVVKQKITFASLKVTEIMNASRAHSSGTIVSEYPHIPYTNNLARDLIYTHRLVSVEECAQRFEFFHQKMLPYYPIISFAKKLTQFENLLDQFPLLLLACITVTTVHNNGFLASSLHNRSLQSILDYYLERFLSNRIFIQADSFNIQLVQTCIILSVWSPPPNRLGHFKNLVILLQGLNISLCIGLGDCVTKHYPAVTGDVDDGDKRNDLRTFLSVYCNCGSLGLSLNRFKLVTWSRNHDLAVTELQRDPAAITRHDRFVIYYAKSIKLSQEIYLALSIDGAKQTMQKTASASDGSILSICLAGNDTHGLPLNKLIVIAENYESQLFTLLKESNFLNANSPEAHLLSIFYYQVLLAIYDKLLAVHLAEAGRIGPSASADIVYIDLISKLITVCENMINAYIQLNVSETVNYPTFVYYRPMHALVLLIRLRLLSKAQALQAKPPATVNIDVELFFERISHIISDNQQKYNLDICLAMMEILTKIERWIKISNEYTSGALDNGDAGSHTMRRSNLLIDLMDRSKHQEIEALEVPHEIVKEVELIGDTKRRKIDRQTPLSLPLAEPDPQADGSAAPHTIEEIFQEIDADIMNYLNLLESNSNTNTGDQFAFSADELADPQLNSTAAHDLYFANFFSKNSGPSDGFGEISSPF